MLKPILIGIDPGVSGGGIAVLKDGKLYTYKMPEKFKDINELLKPFGRGKCTIEMINSRPNFSPFANKRMEPLLKNYERVKDALEVNEIEYQEVAPGTWQKYHDLVLPRGKGEKGMVQEYERLKVLKDEQKRLPIHLSIENKVENDVVWSLDVKYLLETSGREAARKCLKDDYWHFTKADLKKAIKEVEAEITKIKAKEKQIRKNRYKAKAQTYLEGSGIKATLWNCDAILLLLYQKYNPIN